MDQPYRTVLMLGAGASAGSMYRLPVMYGFFDPDGPADISDSLLRGLRLIYGDSSDVRDINVEEVLAYLDMTARARMYADPRTVRETDYVEPLRLEIERYIQKRLEVPMPALEIPGFRRRDMYITPENTDPSHRALLNRYLSPTTEQGSPSTVMTTNYDLVVDWTLRALEKEVWPTAGVPTRLDKWSYLRGRRAAADLSRDPMIDGWYLKLHGSLDWFYCPNDACSYRADCFSAVFDSEWGPGVSLLPDHYHPNIPCLCGAHYRSLIVPPTMSKDYRQYPSIEAQWRIAVTQLQEANHLIIVGLSFAPSDTRLMWLMRYALRGFGDRRIDLVYLAASEDASDTVRHTLVRRVQNFVPAAVIHAYPDGRRAYVESEGLVDHHSTRPSGV